MKNLSDKMREVLETFHSGILVEARKRGASNTSLGLLTKQLKTHGQAFEYETKIIKDFLVEKQKEASRGFPEVVLKHMRKAYRACDKETGKSQSHNPDDDSSAMCFYTDLIRSRQGHG